MSLIKKNPVQIILDPAGSGTYLIVYEFFLFSSCGTVGAEKRNPRQGLIKVSFGLLLLFRIPVRYFRKESSSYLHIFKRHS
jgi:hypothetical protein